MSSNLTDLPAKADQDSLNMAAYADALTMFVADAEAPLDGESACLPIRPRTGKMKHEQESPMKG